LDLRCSASSRPIRTRWRFLRRLPFRGVDNHTWRKRTFQIARLLIFLRLLSKAAGTLGKMLRERKHFLVEIPVCVQRRLP